MCILNRKIVAYKADSGFTLIEMLIVITIIGIMIGGLQQIMTTAITAYDSAKEDQDLLTQARYSMERMVKFVQETDAIVLPVDPSDGEILKVNERMMDTYDNATNNYAIDGDGLLDADNDSDKQVNESGEAADLITFNLDKTDSDNWKLQEEMPDYDTASPDDYLATKVLSEYVTTFTCNLLAPDLVEIELTLTKGIATVSLTTRAKSRMID